MKSNVIQWNRGPNEKIIVFHEMDTQLVILWCIGEQRSHERFAHMNIGAIVIYIYWLIATCFWTKLLHEAFLGEGNNLVIEFCNTHLP